MRIAVLADIHGNAHALDAVLADIDRQAPDVVVNLGDCFSGPLDVERTADLLLPRQLVTVRGNCDRQLVDQSPSEMSTSDRAAAARLHPEARTWLARLPATATVEGVLLCHGTPDDDTRYLVEQVDGGESRLAASAMITKRVGDADADVILCGHSHVPRVVAFNCNRLIINPGSVGLPAYESDGPDRHIMQVGSPHARYAVLDGERGRWHATLHCVEYDWHAASVLAQQAGREDWAYALLTGDALEPYRA